MNSNNCKMQKIIQNKHKNIAQQFSWVKVFLQIYIQFHFFVVKCAVYGRAQQGNVIKCYFQTPLTQNCTYTITVLHAFNSMNKIN